MKQRNLIILLIAVLILLLPALYYLLIDKSVTAVGTAGSSTQAATLFGNYCTPCHGSTGKGDGEIAYLLYPKPRNFAKGMFKLRSTPSGQPPTDEDLAGTIRKGMPGTAMPSFHFLKQDEITKLVGYVKDLSQECLDGQPCQNHFAAKTQQPIAVPKPLPYSKDLVSKGKDIYAQLGCVQCHGESGTGDGPSATGLKDAWGYPIQVRDFTRGTYVGGGKPEDLYLRFMGGMDGTPMPSFESTIGFLGNTEQERQELVWSLIHYVKSLEKQRPEGPAPGNGELAVLSSTTTESELSDPRAAGWTKAPGTSIPLSRLWQKNSTTAAAVTVRAQYNGRYIAFLLEWTDTQKEAGSYRIQDFQDAAAVQFSLTDSETFLGMGARNNPVNLWFWRSEWQTRVDNPAVPDIRHTYTNTADDGDVSTYPAAISAVTLLAGRDAMNPIARESLSSPVEDLNAAGAGTLTSQKPDQQNVKGRGVSDGNKWRVAFVRELRTKDREDIQFKTGKLYPVAFAIWNGSEKDRNGQKLVSTWYRLNFQE